MQRAKGFSNRKGQHCKSSVGEILSPKIYRYVPTKLELKPSNKAELAQNQPVSSIKIYTRRLNFEFKRKQAGYTPVYRLRQILRSARGTQKKSFDDISRLNYNARSKNRICNNKKSRNVIILRDSECLWLYRNIFWLNLEYFIEQTRGQKCDLPSRA